MSSIKTKRLLVLFLVFGLVFTTIKIIDAKLDIGTYALITLFGLIIVSSI